MKTLGVIAGVLLVLFFVFALAFGMEWAGIAWKGFFGPKHEAVRRTVFKETRSYNEGKLQDLTRFRHEWMVSKDADEKRAIEATVRVMFAEYPVERLPSELQGFLRQCRDSR